MKAIGFFLLAWFIFSLNGDSALEPARLVSSQAYPAAKECADRAKLLQGGQLSPFYYCLGSDSVADLPEMERDYRVRVDGLGDLRPPVTVVAPRSR